MGYNCRPESCPITARFHVVGIRAVDELAVVDRRDEQAAALESVREHLHRGGRHVVGRHVDARDLAVGGHVERGVQLVDLHLAERRVDQGIAHQHRVGVAVGEGHRLHGVK
jgi:hypothetical protein